VNLPKGLFDWQMRTLQDLVGFVPHEAEYIKDGKLKTFSKLSEEQQKVLTAVQSDCRHEASRRR
jgi:hypothetical protein